MPEHDTPVFDVADRGFRVRAFYVPETLLDSDHAHVCITRNGSLVQLGFCMAYRVWNLAAHFSDYVDEQLWKEKASSNA